MEATGQDNTTFTCKGEIKNQYVKLASLSLLHWNGWMFVVDNLGMWRN